MIRQYRDYGLLKTALWVGGILLLMVGIYLMSYYELFPKGCTASKGPCQTFDTDRECSAKILAKGLRDRKALEKRTVSFPGNVKRTHRTATVKLSDTQFVIVEYQSACEVIFESAKLAKLEQP